MKVTTIKIREADRYGYNWDQHMGDTSKGTPCIACAKIVEKPVNMLHVCDGGDHASMAPSYDCDDSGHIGLLPIGPECLRDRPELKPFVIRPVSKTIKRAFRF